MLNTNLFTYNKEKNRLFACVTDLPGADNNIQESIQVVSERTGKKVWFEFVQTIFNPDGDLVWWIYKSLETTVSMEILND